MTSTLFTFDILVNTLLWHHPRLDTKVRRVDSAKSDRTRVSDDSTQNAEVEPSTTSFLPTAEVGISSLDILRGRESTWVLGPKAPSTVDVRAEDIYKWARRLEDGIPLDMGPYEEWALNMKAARAVEVVVSILQELEDMGEDYELSIRVANLLRLIAKSINGREGVWREYQASLWASASDIIERHQDNMFGRRNLAFLCLEMGNWKDASKLLDRVVQDMRDEKALCGKAIALRRLGRKHDSLKWFEEASRKNPGQPSTWRDMGDLLLDIGRTEDAINCFKMAVKLRPTWGEVWEIMGYAYEEAGNMEESKECLAKASNLLPSADRREEWAIYQAALTKKGEGVTEIGSGKAGDTGVNVVTAEEMERLENERQEIDTMRLEMDERENELATKFTELKDREAEIAREEQEKDEVCDLLDRVGSLDKDNVLAFWRKGYTSMATFEGADVEELMEAGNISKSAAERIRRILDEKAEQTEEMPKDEYGLMEEAMISLEEDKFEEALDHLNTITKNNPDNEEAWFNKAEIFATMGKNKEAVNSYQRALELNPKNPKAWMEHANLLMQEGFPMEAIRSLRRFLELDPKNSQYLRERAEAFSYAGDYGNAILCYNSILQVRSEDVDALVGLGDAMLNLSDVEEADKFFQQAIRLAPSDERAWCKRAHILNRKGRWGAAIQLYNRSISLKWNYAEPWMGKAEIHLRQGDYDVAVDSYDKAIKIDSSDPHGWYGKGVALEKKKDYTRAERCYKKALKLNKSFHNAKEGLDRVHRKEEE
jgi:tetratricopeptide (TPR) repeat protein